MPTTTIDRARTLPTPTTSDSPRIEAPRAPARGAEREPRLLRAGCRLYRQGDEARRVYEVASGVLRVVRLTEGGRRQVVAFAYPGMLVGFGEDGAHGTECEAITDARVHEHDHAALERPGGDPALHRRLTRAALHEIARMQDHFVTLGRKSATERVAAFLWRLGERAGQPRAGGVEIALPMRRADIADHLGLTIETVSRSFTRLRRSGLIALQGAKTVLVPDPAALAEAAERE